MHRSSFDAQFEDLVNEFNRQVAEERARFEKDKADLKAKTRVSWRDAEWQESKDQERTLLAQIETLEKIRKPLGAFLEEFPIENGRYGEKIKYSEATHSEFFKQEKKLIKILSDIQKERKERPELFPADADKPRSQYYKFVTQHLQFFHDRYVAPSDPTLQSRDETYIHTVFSRAKTIFELFGQEIERRKEPVRKAKCKRIAKRQELFGRVKRDFVQKHVDYEAGLIKELERELVKLEKLFPAKKQAIAEYREDLYKAIELEADKLPVVGHQHKDGIGTPEEKKKTPHYPVRSDTSAASASPAPGTLSSHSKFKERPKRDRTLAQGAGNVLGLKRPPR